MRKAASLLLALLAGGCSTLTEGTSQQIVVNTSPTGADCVLTRNGETLGHVNPTPGAILVTKTKHDILISCVKEGYVQASRTNKSDLAASAAGNVGSILFLSIIGGGIGMIVDSATGADNKYNDSITVALNPIGGAAAVAAPGDAPPGAPAFEAWLSDNRDDLTTKFEHYVKYNGGKGGIPAASTVQSISEIRYIDRTAEGYVVAITFETGGTGGTSEDTQTVLVKIDNDRVSAIEPA